MKLLTIGFLVSLLIDYSLANCKVHSGDQVIDISGESSILIQSPVEDTATEFTELQTENVVKIETIADTSFRFMEADPDSTNVKLRPTAEFANYEKDSEFQPSPIISARLKFTCQDDSTHEVTFHQPIRDTNNHKPEFSEATYEFELPMPFPAGMVLTAFGGDIEATDIDVSNSGMDFVILDNGVESDAFVVVYAGTTDQNKKTHKGIVKTQEALRLTQDTTYTIRATDKGTPTESTETTMTIKINEEGSVLDIQFDKLFYEATYHVNEDLHTIDPVTVKVTEGAEISIESSYNSIFSYDEGTKQITLIGNLDENVIDAGGYITVTIIATLRTSTAEALLIVQMPEKVNVEFGEVLYKTNYHNDNTGHSIDAVDIVVTDGAVISFKDGYDAYFTYDNTQKIITLNNPLEENVINAGGSIAVGIEATIGSSTAEAVLLVALPDQISIVFDQLVYKTVYNNDENQHTIDTVSITVTEGATISFNEYEKYFTYNENDKTITLAENLEEDVINSGGFIDVKMTATLNSISAEAVLLITLPGGKDKVAFDEVIYKTTYHTDNEEHSIDAVTISVTDGATISFKDGYDNYFIYDDVQKTITLKANLDDNIINAGGSIAVGIEATKDSSIAEAVILVSLPEQISIVFDQIVYKTVYNNDENQHTIDTVPITITEGASLSFNEYDQYFTYNENDKTITLNENLEEDVINSGGFIDVKMTATLNSISAEAVLLITLPGGKDKVAFDEVIYKTTYHTDNEEHSIDAVTISVTDGATISFKDGYDNYFTYDDVQKTITLKANLDDNIINAGGSIAVGIEATKDSSIAEAVILVSLPEQISIVFDQIVYKTVYNNDENQHTIDTVPITITEGASLSFNEYDQYFTYNENDKTITLNENLEEDVINSGGFIDVKMTATLNSISAEAVLLITLPGGKDKVAFDEVIYKTTYHTDNEEHSIDAVTISVTDGATISFKDGYNNYFTYDDVQKTITLKANLDDNVINAGGSIAVGIEATKDSSIAEAVILVSLPEQISIVFDQIVYKTVYNNDENQHTIDTVPITVTEGATLSFNEYDQYFTYNENDKTITLKENLEEDVINSGGYIDVKITATLNSISAEAVLLVTLPGGKGNVAFGQVIYKTRYHNDNSEHSIDSVPISVTDGATISFKDGYDNYFAYDDVQKTITLKANLEDNVINAGGYIDVGIVASMDSSTANAALIVSLPGEEISINFDQIVYKTVYNNDETQHTIDTVLITVTEGATLSFNEYDQYFTYNENDKTITLKENLEEDVINSGGYIDVKITATLNSISTEAVLIVTLPGGGSNVAFGQVIYKTRYHNDNSEHSIDAVSISVTDGATISFKDGYDNYFAYDDVQKTITLKANLEDTVIKAGGYIDVGIVASMDSSTANAALIVSLPGEETSINFDQIVYKTVYNNDETQHTIETVLITVTEGATLSFNEYDQYFTYNENDKTITLKENLEEDVINSGGYIDVKITATLNSISTEAVLIVTLPGGGSNVAFGQVIYKTRYHNDNSEHSIDAVSISVTDGATISFKDGYDNYFAYDAVQKTITLKANLEDNVIKAGGYIDVGIVASMDSSTANAALIVSLPGEEITINFDQIVYKTVYNNDETQHTIDTVLITVTEGATLSFNEYDQYFTYNENDKTITLKENLEEDVIYSGGYIDVKITATLNSISTEAVLIVTLPGGGSNVAFGQVLYKTRYHNDNSEHSIDAVSISVTDGATISFKDGYDNYFAYDDVQKTITLKANLEDNVINAGGYIDVGIVASMDSSTANAALIVSLPGEEISINFDQIVYKTVYNNDETQHTIETVLITVTEGATLSFNEYDQYFTYNENDKTITLKENLQEDVINSGGYIDVKITATLNSISTEAVLIVTLPGGGSNVAFGQVLYKTRYHNDNSEHSIDAVPISVTDGATISFKDGYDNYFAYDDVQKTITLKANLEDNVINAGGYIDVGIVASMDSSTANAALIVSLPGEEISINFDQIVYKTVYNNDETQHTIDTVLITVTEGATLSFNEYDQYFTYNENDKTITLKENLEEDVINSGGYIDVKITATLNSISTEAVLIVTLPGGGSNVAFGQVIYKTRYHNDNSEHSIDAVSISVTDGATITFKDGYDNYFAYDDVQKTITLKANLEDNVINAGGYIDVGIVASLDSSTANAALIVSLPGEEISINFDQIVYKTVYNNDETQHTIDTVLITVTEGATLSFNEYDQYFTYNENDKTITLKENLQEDVINSGGYIDVKITATLNSISTEAVLIVTLPGGGSNVAFGQVLYKTRYHNDNSEHSIDAVPISVTDGATISFKDGYDNYFAYDDVQKTITLKANLEDNVINAGGYIDVGIVASMDSSTANAALIVSLPGEEISINFDQIVYKTVYNNDETQHTIDTVLITVTEGATLSFNEYDQYFTYNENDKTITLKENLEEDVINSGGYIDVKITATLNSISTEAVLIVTLPGGGSNVAFGQVIYKTRYHNDNSEHSIDAVSISVTDGATITFKDGYDNYFAYDDVQKTITLKANLEDNVINAGGYIDVGIVASLDSSTANAALIVSLPGEEISINFDQIVYKTVYNNDETQHTIDTVLITVTEGATLSFNEYDQYFTYNENDKTITLKENLEEDVINSGGYIDVKITATLNSISTEAVLIVTLPGGGSNVAFGQVIYKTRYHNDNSEHSIDAVSISVTDGATISFKDGYDNYFAYDDVQKTITLKANLEDNVIKAGGYIDVGIVASIDSSTANAAIIVSLPGDEISINFDQVVYKTVYNNDETQHTIDTVFITVTEGATVSFNEYDQYFTYNENDKTITLKENLEEDVINSGGYIDVKITATLNSISAESVLIITLPDAISVEFDHLIYKTNYNNGVVPHTIDTVSIKVTEGASVSFKDGYDEYFSYNANENVITLTQNLDDSVLNAGGYLDVTIIGSIGSTSTEVVLIISLPDKDEYIEFGEPLYSTEYNIDGDDHTIEKVQIYVSEGTEVTLKGAYNIYFEYNREDQSISLSGNIPDDVIESNTYVEVFIHAEKGNNAANAVLIVTMPSECPNPPSAVITFTSELVFTSDSGDLEEKIEATSTMDEDITFSLRGNVPSEVILYTDGRLQTIGLPSGFYDIEIVARGSISMKTASARLKILIGSSEVCPDGEILNTYSYQSKLVTEEQEETIILPTGDGYTFEIEKIEPSTNNFKVTADGFVASKLDRESSEFAGGKAQYIATLKLIKSSKALRFLYGNVPRVYEHRQKRDTPTDDQCFALDDIKNIPNQVIVGITVDDINDHHPEFEQNQILIGYPKADLLSSVSPSHLVTVQATDKDTGSFASLEYSSSSNRITVHPKTGYVYPTESFYDDDEDIKVIATDEDGNGLSSDALSIKVKLLDNDNICILKFDDKVLEDLEGVLDALQSRADIRYLTASVLPREDSFSRAENSRYLIVTAYAFKEDTLLTLEDLKDILDDVDGLTVEALPKPDDGGNDGDGENDDDSSNTGYIAAISVLAVLLALCLIGFIAFYFLKLRKNKPYDKMEEEGFPSKEPVKNGEETPRFTKSSGPVTRKSESEINSRRPTGYIYPTAELFEEPIEAINTERERRKSVVFNTDVEEINIEREAEDQDDQKKDQTADSSENNTKL